MTTTLQLSNAMAVKIWCLAFKEVCVCLSQVCHIYEGFPTKVLVQRTEDVFCWHPGFREANWMAQCLPAKSTYDNSVDPHHMSDDIVMEEDYTLMVNQCYLLI